MTRLLAHTPQTFGPPLLWGPAKVTELGGVILDSTRLGFDPAGSSEQIDWGEGKGHEFCLGRAWDELRGEESWGDCLFMMGTRFIAARVSTSRGASFLLPLLLTRSLPSSSSFVFRQPPPYSTRFKIHTMAPTSFKLNNGQEIPAVGLGRCYSLATMPSESFERVN